MTLRIHLLGQPRLYHEDNLIKFNAPPKTLPLLAYLLLNRERVIDRQQVAFALWPDESENQARANLRRHLHQLQHNLPEPAPEAPWLLINPQTVRWNPQASYWLDVAELEKSANHNQNLEEAASLYKGDLLENSYDDWIFFERERLRTLYQDTLSRLATQHRSTRNFSKAILFIQQLLKQDPLREDAIRQLISLRYESGDRARAIQEYENFEKQLREEMGVAPMPETRALLENVLHNARLASTEVNPPEDIDNRMDKRLGITHTLPFVGRANEIQYVTSRWSRAVRGHGGLLLIGGEAGVGKTRLAREIALHAESQGGRVLNGGVSPGEQRAYQPIVEAFEVSLPLISGLELSPMRMAALAALVPQLHQIKNLPILPALDPDRDRIRLFDAITTCIELLSGPRPLLLILEDLHWAGEATIGLIEFIARRASPHPILILGTYRDEETPRSHPLRKLRRILQTNNLVDHLALGRLSASAIQSLVSNLPEKNSFSTEQQQLLSDRLYEESEGNPLWIDQLLDYWRQNRDFSIKSDLLPNGIRAAILWRISRISEASRAFAEAASILGQAFDSEVVREVGGWDEAQAHQSLNHLLDSRLVRDTEGRSRFDYTFAHHLIQTALYDEIPPTKRIRRHLRAAEIMQEMFPERSQELAGEIACHFDLGGDASRAIPMYLENARRQVSLFADSEALTSINRALELSEEDHCHLPPRLRADLLLLRESIYTRKGLPQKQWDDLTELRGLAAELGDSALEFEIIRRQIDHQRNQRNLPSAFVLINDLKQVAGVLNATYWNALSAQVEAQLHIANNNHDQAVVLLNQAINIWESLGDTSNLLYCLCYLSDTVQLQRKAGEVEILLEKALTLCKEDTPPTQLMRTLLSAANAGLVNNNYQRCMQYGKSLAALAEQVGDLSYQATGYRLIGIAATHFFEINDARNHLTRAATIFHSIQRIRPYSMALESLGLLELAVGQYPAAVQFFQQSLEIVKNLNQLDGICTAFLNLSFTYCLQENFQAEKENALQALIIARQLNNRYFEALSLQNLGDAERGLGHLEDALSNFIPAETIMKELGQQSELSSLQNDLALTYLFLDQMPQALHYCELVMQAYPQIKGSDDNLHRYLWIAARIFRAAGQEEKASNYLEQAYQEFHQALQNIPDKNSQQAFANMHHNRLIVAAHDQGVWP